MSSSDEPTSSVHSRAGAHRSSMRSPQGPGRRFCQVMEKTIGIHAQRKSFLPMRRERFYDMLVQETKATPDRITGSAEVSVFPTCFVEYMEPKIAKDLVSVYERNHIACSLPAGTRCCGAPPWLHSGNVEQVRRRAAKKMLQRLAKVVRAGRDVVVSQPTCAYVMKARLSDLCTRAGCRTSLPRIPSTPVNTSSTNIAVRAAALTSNSKARSQRRLVHYLACHLRAQNIGFKGRDLPALAGTTVKMIERCSGIDGTWGYRAENYDAARKVARAARARAQRRLTPMCFVAIVFSRTPRNL